MTDKETKPTKEQIEEMADFIEKTHMEDWDLIMERGKEIKKLNATISRLDKRKELLETQLAEEKKLREEVINYLHALRKSNDLWRMSNDDLANEIEEKLRAGEKKDKGGD